MTRKDGHAAFANAKALRFHALCARVIEIRRRSMALFKIGDM